MAIYIYFIVGIFPFWLHDGFFDISRTKSEVFVTATFCMGILCLLLSLAAEDWKWCTGRAAICIYGVAVYLLISNFHSAYQGSAWWGTLGRYQGTVVYLSYCLAALCILSFGKYERHFVTVFLVAGMLVSLLCILNFYEVDPLGTKDRIVEWQRHIYTSTIGNVDIFSAYLSVFVPIASVRAVRAPNWKKSILWYGCCFLGFWAMSAAGCNSVYLTLGALAVCLPWFCVNDLKTIWYCIVLYVVFVASQLACQIWDRRLWFPLLYMDGMAAHFVSPFLIGGAVVSAALLAAGYWVWRGNVSEIDCKRFRKYCARFMFAAAAVFAVIYISSTEFDVSWGNGRGFIWMQGIDFFLRQPLDNQLFGIGMDCIKPVFQAFYGKSQTVVAGLYYYDNLHNEYFQYMVTVGVAGLLIYLIFFGKSVWNLLKRNGKDTDSLAVGLAGLCYALQAVVNISMSSVTGIIFVLLFAGQIIKYPQKNCEMKEKQKE